MTIKRNAVTNEAVFGTLSGTYQDKDFFALVNKRLCWHCDNAAVAKILWTKYWIGSRTTSIMSGGRSNYQIARDQLMSAYKAFGGTLELGPDEQPKHEGEWNTPPPKELREDD